MEGTVVIRDPVTEELHIWPSILHVSMGELAEYPRQLLDVKRAGLLTELYLHMNQLTSLPSEIGALTGLTELWLNNNQLTALPSEIGALTCLTTLTLWENQLTSLPSEIGALMGLKALNMESNQLTSLPSEIGALTGLTMLDLRSNPLVSPLPLAIETWITNLRRCRVRLYIHVI